MCECPNCECELESLTFEDAQYRVDCQDCGKKLTVYKKDGDRFRAYKCSDCNNKTYSEGVRAGSSGILEQYEKMGWLIPKLNLVCSDCGQKLITSHNDGELKIYPCSKCMAKQFVKGKSEGRKEMGAAIY